MNTITIINKETGERQELTPEQLSQFMSHMASQIKAQQERIAELEAQVPKWQPIETAPKNGTQILARWERRIAVVGYYDQKALEDIFADDPLDEGFYLENYNEDYIEKTDPTHWMPLPNLPTESKQGDE